MLQEAGGTPYEQAKCQNIANSQDVQATQIDTLAPFTLGQLQHLANLYFPNAHS